MTKIRMKKSILTIMTCIFSSLVMAQSGPVLSIEGGKVQGVKTDIEGVTVYRGLPYAAPPIGDLRWKAPQPVVAWDGVKLADKFGHPGYQSVHYPGGYTTEWGYGDESPYSEDCLYLNVWTPAPGEATKKLPVALWIHGGGYREGWGSEPEFDAQEWAKKGVVLVSINYRLGVFGFLAHPELSKESPEHVSGNYGILDQIESLKWIKKNIAQFGGDPDNVMIFGQSAGGGSVRTLCESPLARGLFHKAIIMSAGGLSAGGRGMALNMEGAEQMNKKILDWAGINSLEKMRKASTETLHTVGNIYASVTGDQARMPLSPIVDGYVCKKGFDEAAMDGSLADVPYMIGFTMNDLGFVATGILEFCYNREEVGHHPVWAYEFARPLPTDGRENVLKGAFHSSDLWYVFKSLKHCWRPWAQGDWDLSERMLTAWTNFAKYGNPNGNVKKGEWTPCTKKHNAIMRFLLDANDKDASNMGEPIKVEAQPWANADKK